MNATTKDKRELKTVVFTGPQKRTEAMLNLFFGIFIGVTIIPIVAIGANGNFLVAMLAFMGVIVVIAWRARRVFKVIEE